MNKQTREGMGSSKNTEWFTPRYVFDLLNEEFRFTTDVCTSRSNPLGCPVFFSKENDGLKNFDKWQGNCFCNPPYGDEVDDWVIACSNYAKAGRGIAVMLIAARTDTERFHKYMYDSERWDWRENVKVRLLKGRIKFLDPSGKPSNSAFFPSMVVIFYPPPSPPEDGSIVAPPRIMAEPDIQH